MFIALALSCGRYVSVVAIACVCRCSSCVTASNFSSCIDVFCLSQIFELGKFPWWQCSNSEVIDTVCKGQEFLPQPDLCPDSLYRLMLSCWSMSSEQRPTFKKILEKLKEIKKEVLPLCDEGAASDMDFDFDVSLTVSRLMLQRSARDEELAEKSMRQTLYSMSPSPSFINNSEISSSS